MRTSHRILIGVLVGLFFAAGYATRMRGTELGRVASRAQQTAMSASGTTVASSGIDGGITIDLRPLETMVTVLKSLREHYVEQLSPPDEGKMTYDALKFMLGSLRDPNTRFVEPAQRKLISEAYEGTFHGIGAIMGIKKITNGKLTDEHLIVIAPIESSPAAEAGLKPGDDIVQIDGKAVLPFDPYQKAGKIVKDEWNNKNVDRGVAKKHLKAEQDRIEGGIAIIEAERLLASDDKKPVELTVERKGSPKQIKIKITPAEFKVNPVTSSLMEGDKIGYIKINCFCRTTGEQFQRAIDDMNAKQAKGLVLDLRGVAGGQIEPVLEVAKPLLSGKTLAVELRSRARRSNLAVPSASADQAWSGPVMVLVDGGTARMSEVLAAAIRDNRVGRLVGEKTYGDFSESTLIDQKDGSALMMTTGMFLTGKGGDYNGKGLPVDREVAAGPGDSQLKEAVRLLNSGEGKG